MVRSIVRDNLIRSIIRDNNLVRNDLIGDNLVWNILVGDNNLFSSWFHELIRGGLTRNEIIISVDNIRSLVDNNLTAIVAGDSVASISPKPSVQELIKIISIIKVNVVVSIENFAEFVIVVIVEQERTLQVLLIFPVVDGKLG